MLVFLSLPSVTIVAIFDYGNDDTRGIVAQGDTASDKISTNVNKGKRNGNKHYKNNSSEEGNNS